MSIRKYATLVILISSIPGLVQPLCAQSDTFEWTGMGTNSSWNNVDNWINLTTGDPGFPTLGDSALFSRDATVTGGSAFDIQVDPSVELALGGNGFRTTLVTSVSPMQR